MTPSAGGVATVFALGYLAATVVVQFPPLSRRFALLDRVGVLPRWKFFTQGNGAHDFAVETRDRGRDGRVGAWTPVAVAVRRRLRTALWYPERHRADVYWLAIVRLARRAEMGREAGPETSRAYALLLERCLAAPRGTDATGRQFALVRVAAGRRERVFTSDFHPL